MIQAVVLAEMGAQVYSIERQKKLFEGNKNFAYLKKYLQDLKKFYMNEYNQATAQRDAVVNSLMPTAVEKEKMLKLQMEF